MTTDELRAKFEEWAAGRGLRIRRHDIRCYWYCETMAAWEIWQAAHASRDAEVEALRKDAERFQFVVKYCWISPTIRFSSDMHDSDIVSARRVVDQAMLDAAMQVPGP